MPLRTMYDLNSIRKEFPILSKSVYGKPLIYLDNAATTQKPRVVVDSITDEYYNANANVHRGLHYLSGKATELLEGARDTVRQFINAAGREEIIFTRGTTESLNLLASSFSAAFLKPGDEIMVSAMEHHSNLVPWQLEAGRKGFKIRVIPVSDKGELIMEGFLSLFNEKTRLVSLTHVSNVLGTVNPVREIIALAHSRGVPVAIDAAQSVPHLSVDVQKLDADFLAFSGHKIYGPTGIGVLYGKRSYLESMPPYQGGGEMIAHVSFEKTTFNALPYKFEAGTPDYVGATALAAALRFVSGVGLEQIAEHETALCGYAVERLGGIKGLRFIGEPAKRSGVVSFVVDGIHPADVGMLLDKLGIAVRTGHHCAEPLMERFGVPGTVRASFALYNTFEEVDALVAGLERVIKMF